MNARGHLYLSLVITGGLALLLWKLNLKSLLLYSLPMFLTTFLPDIIERPTNFSHRRFFHSRRFFKYLSIGLGVFLFLAISKSPNYFFAFFATFGYWSHLLGDSVSFRGLPR